MDDLQLSASEAIQVELFCLQTPVGGIFPTGHGDISLEERDEAAAKCRSRAVEVLKEYKEKSIPLSDVETILQTADWKK